MIISSVNNHLEKYNVLSLIEIGTLQNKRVICYYYYFEYLFIYYTSSISSAFTVFQYYNVVFQFRKYTFIIIIYFCLIIICQNKK